MKTITKSDIIPLFTYDIIDKKLCELSAIINEEYKNQEIYIICVLKGSVMFTVDFVKKLTMPVQMEFIKLSSYGSARISSGRVNAVDITLPDLNDKNVIILEDIIDTGHTAQFLSNFITHNFRVKSYKFISLLDKKCRREVNINPDMYGFEIDDKFLVGYGLDYDGYYRNLDYVGYVED